MDKFGQGLEFKYSMLSQNKNPNFAVFSKQMLLEMCILSGCDYLPSLPGLGVRRAHALITKFKSYEKVSTNQTYDINYKNLEVNLFFIFLEIVFFIFLI